MTDQKQYFAGKNIMITGGLGMIGSAIAVKLVKCGSSVTIVDSNLPPYGANLFNIAEIKNDVCLNATDARDKAGIAKLVKGKDIIFNLAGQVSHNDSMSDPFLDADINYLSHLNVAENVRKYAPSAIILHAGSRLQYGRIKSIPVNETHPLNPRTPYALNKTAAENMYLFYNDIHNIRCVLFRIANPYGPRSQMKHNKYSIINWFIRLAMEGKTIKVFGDGMQVRDYIFIDDLADAFIAAAATEQCCGKVFNVGSGKGTKFIEMAETIVKTIGSGAVEKAPWPENYINVETGDYVADISRLQTFAGWQPLVSFRDGIKITCDFYRKFKDHYW